MFEFSIEMEKHSPYNDHKNFTPKSQPVKKPVENGAKKNTPATEKKTEVKKTDKKFIARRPAAENGVKTGRVKKNFKNNRGGNVGNFQRNNKNLLRTMVILEVMEFKFGKKMSKNRSRI